MSEMLGSDSRWRLEQEDDLDIWEGESESEEEEEEEEENSVESEEDAGGLSSEFRLIGRGYDDTMEIEAETFFCAVLGWQTYLLEIR